MNQLSLHISTLLTKWRRPAVAFAAVAFLAMGATVLAVRPQPLTAYQLQLRSQVDAADGSPKTGRDPISQPQTSLAWAASQPVGNGLRTDSPAAAVTGAQSHPVNPAGVLPNPKATGKQINGCLIGYPDPGEKCFTTTSPTALPNLGLPTPSPHPAPTPASPVASPMPSDMPGMDMSRMQTP
jgi:hypothetical protein